MNIFLVRHGRYDQETGLLTADGEEKILAVGRFMVESTSVMREPPEMIVSPKKRTQQTAELLQKALALPGFTTMEWLDDGPGLEEKYRRLVMLINGMALKNLVVISHMPVIETAVERFAGSFGEILVCRTDYGSVHLVDTDARTVTKLT